MADPKKPKHPLASVGGIAGVIAGWAISRYCGASIWIPAAAAILLLVLFAKTRVRPKLFAGAIAATGAQIIWFIVASAITGAWTVTALDIIVLSVGVVWLWLRPGLAAVIFLGLLQLAALVVNVFSLTAATYGDAAHRALTAHCVSGLSPLPALFLATSGFGANVLPQSSSVRWHLLNDFFHGEQPAVPEPSIIGVISAMGGLARIIHHGAHGVHGSRIEE